MTIKCNKCGAFLEKDPDEIYICTKCLQDLIKIKREIWENESAVIDKKQVDDSDEDC